MQPGLFIAFEGLDGSGHTTQAEKLKDHFTAQGKTAFVTHEPTTESEPGQEIIKVLRHEKTLPPDELQKLFVADRAEHLKNTILPSLERGEVVIADRYLFSTIAFGSIDCPVEWLVELNSTFRLPDLTFIIDASPETCLTRINKRGTPTELFERAEKLAKARATYLTLPSRFPNMHVVDGEKSIDEVFTNVVALSTRKI